MLKLQIAVKALMSFKPGDQKDVSKHLISNALTPGDSEHCAVAS